MQIMPPSVEPTVENSKPQFGWMSKRRLFFLVATAATASGLGMALGGTLRFQVLSVVPAPLFKPQQDFPPLAEWPPEVPSAQDLENADRSWDEPPAPQLVYNERPTEELEYNDVYQAPYDLEEPAPPDTFGPADSVDSSAASTENIPQNLTDDFFEQETSPPAISTNGDSPRDESAINSPPIEINGLPRSESSLRFNKQPVSEAPFTAPSELNAPEEATPPSFN